MVTPPLNPHTKPSDDPASMNEMLQELRILQQGSQFLTAFLVILPFSARFSAIVLAEKWVYVVTFLCSLASLVLFNVPAVHHRLQRPLKDKIAFKEASSRMIVLGLVPLTFALILMTQLVTSEVIGELPAVALSAVIGLFIIGLWWILPLLRKRKLPPK